jgi:hypothetical protein
MSVRYALRRCPLRPARCLPGLALAGVLLSASLLVAGCQGDSSNANTAAPTVIGDAVSSTVETVDVNAGELADDITATYVDAIHELDALLAGKPEAAAVKGQVAELKEEYIQKFVWLGRQKQTLSEAERTKVNDQLWRDLPAMADETWYTTYTDLWTYYSKVDLEFSNSLASFIYITQYADFELLKTQEPEEAARLGIE